jgi:hypothetical protein
VGKEEFKQSMLRQMGRDTIAANTTDQKKISGRKSTSDSEGSNDLSNPLDQFIATLIYSQEPPQ